MTVPDVHFEDDLSAIDYLMLRGESDPRTRSSMVSIAMLDTIPDFDRLREVFERTSREFVRLRQHVVVPSLPVTAPRWVVDPDFNLDYHLTRTTLPAPGSLHQLLAMAEKMCAAPLDTSRPLWEVLLVEGVTESGTQAALITKLHHAITDGVGGMLLFKSIYDFERNPPQRPLPPLPIPAELSGDELTRKGLAASVANALPTLSRNLGKGLRWGADAIRSPARYLEELRALAASAQRVMGPPPVAPSPLLRRRSLGRRLDCFDFPLARLKAAAKAAGVSVNDAYIAAVCGGLGRYHQALGVDIAALPLAMPVNLRKDDDPAGGNRFAGARLAAPIGEADPVKRMQLVREQVLTAVAEPAINILGAIAPLLSRLPSAMLGSLSASAAAIDVQASNVPGYPEPPYIAGARVVKMYPFGPLPGVAMMVVMVSQGGECFVGIHSDTAAITDPELLRSAMAQGFEEVMASTSSAPKSGNARKPRASTPTAKAPAARARTRATATTKPATAKKVRKAATEDNS